MQIFTVIGGMKLKIGIISDVHGNDIALKTVIENIKEELIEGVIFLGDLIAGGPNPKNTFDQLRELNVISWIKGNTDVIYQEAIDFNKLKNKDDIELSKYYLYALNEISFEDIEFILAKPMIKSICIEGIEILCVHGSPRNITEKMGEEIDENILVEMIEGISEKIIFCGHSHIPSMTKVNEKMIVNVGSVGFPIDEDNSASYVILNINEQGYTLDFKRVEYDIEKIINDARSKDLPDLEKYEEVIRKGVYY